MEVVMEKYISEFGKECYRGVTVDTDFDSLEFHDVKMSEFMPVDDQQWALHTDIGSLTVVDRMTGFGHRDVETGFRAIDGTFWLASGGFNVMEFDAKTIGDAIEWVKKNSNTCVANKA
jgi:hypothetical protein